MHSPRSGIPPPEGSYVASNTICLKGRDSFDNKVRHAHLKHAIALAQQSPRDVHTKGEKSVTKPTLGASTDGMPAFKTEEWKRRVRERERASERNEKLEKRLDFIEGGGETIGF